MFLIAGIGNPDGKYSGTRHNIGRDIVVALKQESGCDDFYFEKKWNAQLSDCRIEKKRAILLLPETYVNKSGIAIAAALRYYKIKPDHLFVVHDDADIIIGHTKMSHGRSDAGHNGIASLIRALRTKNFWRLRIGIGTKKNAPAADTVLKKFTPTEQKIMKDMTQKTIAAIQQSITKNPQHAMNEYHRYLEQKNNNYLRKNL